MKRVLFTLLLFSGCILNGFAVSDTLVWNHPQYYDEGDCWVQALSRYEMGALYKDNPQYKPEFHFAKFYVKGDTIIDKKSYKCVQASVWYYNAGKEPSLTLSSEMSNVLFIREDLEGRQWRLLPGVPDEMLMFDFSESFKEGDTIRYGRHPDLLEWSLYLRREYEIDRDCFDPEYVYFTVEKVVKSVTTTELLNGNQVTIANESLAQGWGSIKEGDLFSQRCPENESLTGRFLFRARQGKVLYEDAVFTDLISEIINQDVKELTLGVSQEHTYCPLVQSGKVWTFEANNHNVSPDYWTEWNETYSLEGDTVIDSHQCLKLYATSTCSYLPLNHDYQGALYEEDEKVYFIAPNGDISNLIYDFSCKVGDVLIIKDINIHYEAELYILQRRVIDYHGSSVTVIGWGPERGEHASLWDIWIEGVGSPLDLFDTLATHKTGGPIKKLTACTLNGETLYDEKSFQEAYKQRDTYRPFIEENKVWHVGYFPGASSIATRGNTYYFDGDTIVGGEICKRWMCNGNLIAPIYERDGQVWLFPKGEETPQLIYNFNVQEGDEFSIYWIDNKKTGTCTVKSVRDAYSQDYPLRTVAIYDSFTLEQLAQAGYDKEKDSEEYDFILNSSCQEWIEGVGSCVRLEDNIGIGGRVGYYYSLVDVKVGDEIIFKNPSLTWDYDAIHAPQSSIINHDSYNHQYYDLSGRRLSTQPLRRGVYVNGGRKVMIK